MKNPISPTGRRGGFTLIEMLVVAALIAIFAGLAVFNIVEQLNREKEKAAIAECRSIATAMSFAHDDLGFYPKLCWLKFGKLDLIKYVQDNGIPGAAIDWFEKGDNTGMPTRIQTKWGEKYMAGGMPEKFVRMTLLSAGNKDVQWPCDPWNQPYMAYLVAIDRPANAPNGQPVIRWANEKVGDKANYFAGIVSYGRNKVPGYVWNDPNAFNNGKALRLFDGPDPADQRHFTLNVNDFNQPRLDVFINNQQSPVQTVPPFNNPPYMRDAASDDKYFEF